MTKLVEIKDKQERKWAIESAATTLRDMAELSKDPEMIEAAKKELEKESKNLDVAKEYINILSAKSPGMKVKDNDKA